MIDGGKFALILLDVMMPCLTGIELLKIVRNDHPASELPIIMATARDKSENMVEALSLGANDYVTKPLDLPVVLARIEAHLKMKNAAAAAKAAAGAPAAAPAPARTTIEPGAVLAGKFLLESKIGSGAFGAVFKAKHLALNSQVAVKVLQSSMMPTQEAVRRFRQEGISACRIQHPNAVSIVDFGVTDDGVAYLVMELLSGHPVSEEIKRAGMLTPRRAAEILLGSDDIPAELADRYGYVNRVLPDAGLDAFVDAFARRIAGFDKTVITDAKALLDLASLPPDDEFVPGLAAFFRTSGRPENAAKVRYLFDHGLQTATGVELNLGREIGGLPDSMSDWLSD